MKLIHLLGRVSVLLPFGMAIYLSRGDSILKLPFADQPLSGWAYFAIYLLWVVLWLYFSPARRACEQGIFQLFFNCYPLLALGALVLMQYHMTVSVVLLLLPLVIPMLYLLLLFLQTRGRKTKRRMPKNPMALFHRIFVLASACLLTVPLLLSILLYRMEPPTLLPEENESQTPSLPEGNEDGKAEFLASFSQRKWDGMTQKARVTLLRQIASEVTSRLGAPEINQLSATTLEAGSLGYYDPDTKCITMNVDVFETASFEEIVRNVLHSAYHHYQYYIIDQIDWSQAVSGSAYYARAKAWKENAEASLSHGQEGFDRQPLEVDASEFEILEWERLQAEANSGD